MSNVDPHATLGSKRRGRTPPPLTNILAICCIVLVSNACARSTMAVIISESPRSMEQEFGAALLRAAIESNVVSERFDVVSRANLNELIAELRRNAEGLLDFTGPATTVPIRPADYFVLAEYWPTSREVILRLKRVDDNRILGFSACAIVSGRDLRSCSRAALDELVARYSGATVEVEETARAALTPVPMLGAFDEPYRGPQETLALLYLGGTWAWHAELRHEVLATLLAHPYAMRRFVVLDRYDIDLGTRAILLGEASDDANRYFGRTLGADFLLYLSVEGNAEGPTFFASRLVDTRTTQIYTVADCASDHSRRCSFEIIDQTLRSFAAP